MILFEELASQFGLKVPDTIERITTLVEEGRLTGEFALLTAVANLKY